MASPMMADYGEHIYIKKVILQLNIKKSQSVHINFMIYLHNLGDKESEKLKRPLSTQSCSSSQNLIFAVSNHKL